jgi:hypothetical protein
VDKETVVPKGREEGLKKQIRTQIRSSKATLTHRALQLKQSKEATTGVEVEQIRKPLKTGRNEAQVQICSLL